MSAEIVQEAAQKMDKAISALEGEFARVRTGRANAAVLDRITIDYYGQPTPLVQIAGVKAPEAHMLVIEPWDKSVLKSIEKAIMASDLGITPSNDGAVIRLPFPAPTEERRREIAKECRGMAEDSRVAIRNVRRDANGRFERAKKDGELSEDEMHSLEKEMQKLTDSHIEKVDAMLKAKEVEVMEI